MSNQTARDPLVTRKVAAEELAISSTTLWRLVNDGTLPQPLKIGQRAGWPRSIWDAWKVEQGWPAPDSTETTAEGGAQ